jgi:hypothetical protein
MGYFDIASGTSTVLAIPVAVHSGTATGVAVDTRGAQSIFVIVHCGTVTSTATMDLKVQSDDNSGFTSATDVTGATFTQLTASNHEKVLVGRVNMTGSERYIRVLGTYGGSGNVPLSVTVTLDMENSADATTADFNLAP